MASDWRDSVEHLVALAPNLKNYPGTTAALVQTPGITDTDIQATAGVTLGREAATWLNTLPLDRRSQEWARMSQAKKDLAIAGGFTPTAELNAPPPAPQEQGDPYAGVGGFFRHVGNGIGDVAHVGKTAAGWGLHQLDRPLDLVQHTERALMDYGQNTTDPTSLAVLQSDKSGILGLANVLRHPSDFARAWRETKDGEKSYNRQALTEVQGQFPASTFNVAKRIAEGEDQNSIYNSAKTQEERDAYDQMFHSPQLQQAVNAVNNSKLGLGRAIAYGLGIDPVQHQTAFKYTSGGIDAASDFFTDPTLVGGKIAKTVKAARWGITAVSADRINELFDTRTALTRAQPVQQFFAGALPHINTIARSQDATELGNAYRQLQSKYQQVVPMLDDLKDFTRSRGGEPLDIAGVKDFLVGQKGAAHLMKGEAAVRGVLMPRKGIVTERVTDRLRDAWARGGATAFLERPSQTMDRVLGKTITDLQDTEQGKAQGALLGQLRKQNLLYRTGMTLARFVEQDPATRNGTLDLMADTAPKTVFNLARTYLPRWHANQVAGAYAAADQSGRMLIYKGLVHTLGEAAGITRDAPGKEWLANFVDRVDEAATGGPGRGFSANVGGDVWADGGQHGLYPYQFQTKVPLPSFRELHEYAARVGMVSRMGYWANSRVLDRFTSAWRPGVLLRPALVFRNALEEVSNHVSKYGVWDFSKGQIARHIVDPAAKEYYKTGMVADIEYRLNHGVGRLLNEQERQHLREFANDPENLDNYLEGIRGTNLRAARNDVPGAEVSGLRRRQNSREAQLTYASAGKDFKQLDTLGGAGVHRWAVALQRVVGPSNALGRIAIGHIDDQDQAISALTDHILSPAFESQRKLSRGFRVELGQTPDDPAAQYRAAQAWAGKIYADVRSHVVDKDGNLLTDLVRDIRQPGRASMEAMTPARLKEIPEESRPASVLAPESIIVQTDGTSGLISDWIAKGYEATGNLTGLLGKNAIHYANYLKARELSAGNGWEKQLADTFFGDLAERTNISMRDPRVAAAMKARDAQKRLREVESHLTQHGAVAAGEAPEWVAGQLPDATELQAEAKRLRKQIDSAEAAMKGPEDAAFAAKVQKLRDKAELSASQHVATQAARTAEMQTLAYVDNPDIRSQAAVLLRNVIPFYRAQEEFYRRWGRTFQHNPEAIRKLQMLHEGAVHSGVLQKDEQGNDIFIYPGSRQTQELMYHAGKLLGWNWAMSPVPYSMSSQVRFLNQGLDPKNIQPSFGPLAAIPLKSLEVIFPEATQLKTFNHALLGDQGAAQKNPLAQIVPTFARRLYESGIAGNDTEQLASAMKTAAIYLEAAGRTPPEGADPAAVEAYQDDLRKWTRVHLFMRALFGTTAPAAPQEIGAPSGAPIGDKLDEAHDPGVYMANHQLIDEFRKKGLPTVASEFRAEVARTGDYNMALANWVRNRPTELPFTVGTTEARYGGFIPATQQAGEFFDSNRDLFHNFPAAAVLFMPQGKGDFNMDVYRTQLGAGLRDKKDFTKFALDLKLAGNLQAYFDLKDVYLKQRGEAQVSGIRGSIKAADDKWSEASKTFKASHPAVAEYLNNYQERANDRTRTMQELQDMVQNNALPRIPGAPVIAKMVDAYAKRQAALAQISSSDRTDFASAYKKEVQASFDQYVKRAAGLDPNADLVYQRLFRNMEDN